MKAFVFPGQGSQYIGMGRDLYDTFLSAKEVFQEVDDVLDQKLSTLMFSGDENELKQTENTQPALMAVSLAVIRVIEQEMNCKLENKISFVAGHSLGEYSALCATGVFSLASTTRLLRHRGQAMKNAVPPGKGGMVALIGATLEQAEEIALKASQGDSICDVANDNAPGQVVLSGHMDAINRAVDLAKDANIKRTVILPVSAPFHSSLMKPAAEKMKTALAQESIQFMPKVRLVSNVTATPLETQSQIILRLVAQITDRVRWVESMNFLVTQGITQVVEVGAGKVLAGLMRRIHKETATLSVEKPTDIENLCHQLAAS